MTLNLERPLLFFDIESTGLNIATDAIIELSFVKVFPGDRKEIKTWKIKPWDYVRRCQIPINPQASAVNGVKDGDLAGCPKFIDVAAEVAGWLKGSDLAGYNSTKFDLPLLAEEFERLRQYCNLRAADGSASEEARTKARKLLEEIDIDFHKARMVDVQTIYHHMEPRNLKAAYRFYCGGEDFEGAHTAEADTLATYEVLKGQLDMYREPDAHREEVLKNDIDYLANFACRPKTVDFAGRLAEKDGEAVITFGKYKDRPAKEVYRKDPGYFRWIEEGEFNLDTKRQFRRIKEEAEEELKRPASEEQLQGLRNLFSKN